jgi:hypothetical protein
MKISRILLFVFFVTCVAGWTQSTSSSVRTVDFRNFSYPWEYPNSWPDHLQWMSLRLGQRIQLVNGTWDDRDDSERADGSQFSGLTLEGVQYVRLSSANSEDAIVVLRYDSGGTQNHYWVYVYCNSGGAPKLLGFFHAGDRAYYGLDQVFVKDRILNIRLFDPKLRKGDCCSSGYINYQFRWNGEGFEAICNPTRGRTDSMSRRPVSVFGLPIDPH